MSRQQGFRHSEETKTKIRLAHRGRAVPLSVRKKISNALKKIAPRGPDSPNWKGGISLGSNAERALYNRERQNRWFKKNRQKKLIANNNYFARAKSNGGAHTEGEWERLKAQYNWTCPVYKRVEPTIKLVRDHIISVSSGGTNNIENIQPLCPSCNSSKYKKSIKY